MARRNNLPLLFLVLIALGLSACAANVDQTITFLTGERWQTRVDLAFPGETAAFMGGAIDSELTTLQQQIEAGGGSMSWARENDDSGRLVYRIEAEGTGYDVLDDVAFGDMSVVAQEQDGERRLTFRALPMFDAAAQSLTLTGGEILSGNGTVNGDSITWVNPTEAMEAQLTERGGAAALNLLPLALVGAGVLLLAGLALLFLRGRRRPAPAYVAPPATAPPPVASPPPAAPPAPGLAAIAPSAARFCVNCGGALRPSARFCAACGHPQPE